MPVPEEQDQSNPDNKQGPPYPPDLIWDLVQMRNHKKSADYYQNYTGGTVTTKQRKNADSYQEHLP